MKYLKRFNENLSPSIGDYSHFSEVEDILEEAKYILETSFNYNVDVSFKFKDFTCILLIQPIGWNLQKDDSDKGKLLTADLTKVKQLFKPYLSLKPHPIREEVTYSNLLKIHLIFNLHCKICNNQELECQNCEGDKTVYCGCQGGIENCFNCQGDGYVEAVDINCPQCGGSGEQTCELCYGDGKTDCNTCDGTGVGKCQHQWL